jgi:peptidoglycan/LPS O-acetylase OafA/YrhL
MTAIDIAIREGTHRARSRSEVRTDIQALRALAVSGVMLYHLWPHRLPGGYVGVDVFFVISGYLITAHLVGHLENRIRSVVDFWSRRIRRLLPAALMVLVTVLIASRLIAPATQWENTAAQTRAAALYVVNWRLATDAVDYLAAQNPPTPVQHFWSLSVEEQFYLGWPVLILVLVVLASWARRPPAPIVFGGLATVMAASLWYSIQETTHDPARAFFVTPTRVWELGIGGLVAVAQAQRGLGRHRPMTPRPSRPGALLLVWAGLVAVTVAMFRFGDKTPWPGWHALLPTLGCAAVIAANNPRVILAPARLFALRPIQWTGNISYSLYLWHWPLIVLVPYVSGNHLGRLDKLTIIAVSFALAAATKHFVEDPFRRPRWGRPIVKPFSLASVGMALVVGAAALQIAAVHHHDAQAQAAVDRKLAGHDPCFGAPALVAGPEECAPVTSGTLTPDPAAARNDQTPGFPKQPGVKNCFAMGPTYHPVVCSYGPANAAARVAVVGNSHAFQFISAIAPIAEARGWHVTTFVAATCTLNDVTQYPHPVAGDSAGCTKWVHWANEQITRGKFDLVITAARLQVGRDTLSYSPTPQQYTQGYVSALRKLRASGKRILAIRDSPSPRPFIPDCLARHTSDYTACDGERADWMPADPLVAAVNDLHDPHVTTLDLADHICRPTVCPAVIGGVPVYFDNSHLSATFTRTLVPYIAPALERAVRS